MEKQEKKVSWLLAAAILFMPYGFSWFLLRNGYSKKARLIGFGYMVVYVFMLQRNISTTSQIKLLAAEATIPVNQVNVKEQEVENIIMTLVQKNAIKSAKQYLATAGFSRNGLIQQLSSDAGDGYDIADATLAVDSLNNDWNQEAARSAKQYLSIQGFSCKGLIKQLSSSAGDKYTVNQAKYGVNQAGICS